MSVFRPWKRTGPPRDYADQLRDAVLEAEQWEREDPTEAHTFYAIGLRVAAGLYGLPEGLDPVTRHRRQGGSSS